MSVHAPSIHALAPLEHGGGHARTGFLFQDHVAARYCLEMVLGDDAHAVWCETLDDITVLRQAGEKETVEFVQVKSTSSDQLWSISQLCRRNGAERGTSILEKSLANDQCREECNFSIVTKRDVRSELSPLTFALGEPSRSDAMPNLGARLLEKLADYESPNGHNAAWWAKRATWRVLYDSHAVSNHNRYLLSQIVERTGLILFPDQIDTVYGLILYRIVNVSAADKRAKRDAGKLEREELARWINDLVRDARTSGQAGGSGLLVSKLKAAGLDDVAIAAADQLRRSYRTKTLEAPYLDLENMETWEHKVRGLLNRLRANLDSGTIEDDGVTFHSRVLHELAALHSTNTGATAPLEAALQGCMYHMTALCQHRFVRPDP